MQDIVILDVETTGLLPGTRPVEFAALLCNSTGVLKRFESLINPDMPIPKEVIAIHGITDEMVKDAPSAGEVLRDFLKWAETDLMAAHNAPYDVGVISWAAGHAGIELPPLMVIDTCEIAKAAKLTKSNKLETLIEFHGIKTEGQPHRAMRDADACAKYLMLNADVEAFIRPWKPEYEYTSDFPSHLEILPELVRTGTTMTFTYQDDKGGVTERTITPYGWCKQGAFMFQGWCHLREDKRTFRADRIVPDSVRWSV